jgi:hypothetical protein
MRNVAVAVLIAAAAASLPAADRVPAPGGDILITPLIHASVQLEHAGKVMSIRGSVVICRGRSPPI